MPAALLLLSFYVAICGLILMHPKPLAICPDPDGEMWSSVIPVVAPSYFCILAAVHLARDFLHLRT